MVGLFQRVGSRGENHPCIEGSYAGLEHHIRAQLSPLALRAERELEIAEELALHLEAVYDDALAAGLSETKAEARAVQSYDWRLLECELSRVEQSQISRWLLPAEKPRRGMQMETLLQVLRFGARMLQAETSAITEQLTAQRPRDKGTQDGTWVESLLDSNVGQFRTTLHVLLAAVGCLLLIGCINLGGLLIVRASARRHEFAIRAALGASKGRLRVQTLAEVLPLSLVGAGAGVLLAWALLKVLVRLLPPNLPGLETIGLHWPVLAFALALSVLVVLLAGMLPARLAARVRLTEAIQQGSRTVAGGGGLRNALVAAQIAVTLALVFAGGLLARSLVAVLQVNPGFAPNGVLTMQVQAARAQYPMEAEVADYYHRLATRVKTIPGVLEAGAISRLPFFSGTPSGPAVFESKPDTSIQVEFTSTTPGYFAAMGIPLRSGRDFSEHDKETTQPVAIIDDQLARKVFGNESPLGKRLKFGVMTDKTPWIEIVGVAGHIRSGSLETDPRLQLYWPKAQPRPEAQRSQEHGTH